MSMKKKKIIVNEDLQSLFNYINSNDKVVSWSEMIQFACDYGIYEQLYLNHFMIQYLIDEHNNDVRSGCYEKKN